MKATLFSLAVLAAVVLIAVFGGLQALVGPAVNTLIGLVAAAVGFTVPWQRRQWLSLWTRSLITTLAVVCGGISVMNGLDALAIPGWISRVLVIVAALAATVVDVSARLTTRPRV